MRILVISNACFDKSDSNGRNLEQLFAGLPKENLAQFFTYGCPDADFCGKYYRVSDGDALRSLVGYGQAGGEMAAAGEGRAGRSADGEKASGKRIKKTPLSMIAREFAWRFGKWRSERLWDWIDAFGPECVVVNAADNAFLLDFARAVTVKRRVPLVLYSTEEYPFKSYNYVTRRASPLYFAWLAYLRGAYKRLEPHVARAVVNTEMLAEAYASQYGYPVAYLYQQSDIDWAERPNCPDLKDARVSYLGNLGLNRHKALIEVADALGALAPGLKLDVYGRAPERIERELAGCGSIRYRGFVPYDEVVRVIHGSDLLVHAEYDDDFYNRDLRYSFSTKISDSVCSGTPLLMYAPEGLAGTDFVERHGCAFVAHKPAELKPALLGALTSGGARADVLAAAKGARAAFFQNRGEFLSMLEEVAGEGRSSQ